MNVPFHLSSLEIEDYSKMQYFFRANYAVYKCTLPMENRKKTLGGGGREEMMITKLRRNAKALSPIFAVLILIAIAVIAGIVVYMFSSGYIASMMGGGTTGQEKVAVEAVANSAGTVTAHAKSIGGGAVIITDAILKNAAGQNVQVLTLGTAVTLPADGTLTAVACAFTGTNVVTGNTYTVTLVSKEGNQFGSPGFKAA